MDLTIVIVNWNGGEMLTRCLQSIRASRTPFQVKVVVVDNNSSDGSREQAQREFPEFNIFNSGSNLGFGRANNLARNLVTTPLVLFLNPDTEVLGDALQTMVQFMQAHADVGALGCKMRYPDGSVHEQGLQYFPSPGKELLKLMFLSSETHTRFRRFLPYLDPNCSAYAMKLYGGCLLLRKDVLDRVGWYDERYFMYAEDVDLCRAVTDAGWKLYYLSEAEVLHEAGGTSKKASTGFSVLMQCESIAKLIHKYYGTLGRLGYRAAVLLAATLRFAAVLALRSVSWLRPADARADYSGSALKYRLMILWSLGLRKARIAR